MGRQFLPVDRDAPALLPVNMLDWVPEDHVVRLVIDTVEAVAAPELTARLVPPVRSRKGRRRYDPVMLLTLLAYSYLRGVLPARAIEERCRYDVTFRVACGKHVPDHVTVSRFRKRACEQDGLMEELFYAVLAACAAAGLGRLTVVAGDGVKIGANAPEEANRTEAGLERLAAKILAEAEAAADEEAAGAAPRAGVDLLGGEVLPRGWADPRSRARRVRACLEDLKAEREAAEAAARAAGQAYLDGLAAGTVTGRPPAPVAVAAQQIRVAKAVAAQQALADAWQARLAAGPGAWKGRSPGRRPVDPDDAAAVRAARARLDELAAGAAAEAQAAEGGQDPGAPKAPVRNVTDLDSRLMPTRGGGFKQGYNCQDAAADDRLMLGGYVTQDTGDARQATRLQAAAVKGAAVVAAAHAAHAADPKLLRACHDRMCASPEGGTPGHDIAACHTTMTGGIGTTVYDAGYYSEENISADGPDRLIATVKRHATGTQARDHPASGPPPGDATPAQANDWRLRTPEGRALYKRRAPDVEGLHASLEDRIGLRRFSLRGLTAVTGEFLLAGLCHNLLMLSRLT
jgi:transposase